MAIDKHGPGAFVADADVNPDQQEKLVDLPPNLIVGNLDSSTNKIMMFRLSCMDGDVAATRRHLDSGTVNVNCRDSVNMTPLMWCFMFWVFPYGHFLLLHFK